MRPIPTWFRGLAKAAIAAIAIYLAYRLASQTGWRQLATRIAGAHQGYLAAAILFLVARWVFWQWRWGLGLARLGEQTHARRRLTALMASVLANHITPTLRIVGGIFRTRYITRTCESGFARMYGGMVFDQIAQNATATLITWLALILTWWRMERPGLALGAAATLIAAFAILWFRARSEDSLRDHPFVDFVIAQARKRTERLQPLLDKGKEAVAAFTVLAVDPRLRLPAFLLSLGFIASNLAGCCLQERETAKDRDMQRQLDYDRQRLLQEEQVRKEIEEQRLYEEWKRARLGS